MRTGNFNHAKIYKIISEQTDKVYIGSTTERYLCNRIAKHRQALNKFKKTGKKYCASFEILKYDDAKIVLIADELNVNSKDQLRKIEQHYIDLYKDVKTNKQNAYTDKVEYKKQYRENNKDAISEQKKQYRETKKDYFKQYDKQYREANKDAIKEYKNEKHTCACCGKYTTGNKLGHLKTKKHTNYLLQQVQTKFNNQAITDYYKDNINDLLTDSKNDFNNVEFDYE